MHCKSYEKKINNKLLLLFCLTSAAYTQYISIERTNSCSVYGFEVTKLNNFQYLSQLPLFVGNIYVIISTF